MSDYVEQKLALETEARGLATFIGKFSSDTQGLHHSYYQTKSGILILDSLVYFNDTIFNPGFTAFCFSCELPKQLPEDKARQYLKHAEQDLKDHIASIDEIITFVWPENSKGIAEPAYMAAIEDYSSDILTSDTLETLYSMCNNISNDKIMLHDKNLLVEVGKIRDYMKGLQKKFYELIGKDRANGIPKRETMLLEQIRRLS